MTIIEKFSSQVAEWDDVEETAGQLLKMDDADREIMTAVGNLTKALNVIANPQDLAEPLVKSASENLLDQLGQLDYVSSAAEFHEVAVRAECVARLQKLLIRVYRMPVDAKWPRIDFLKLWEDELAQVTLLDARKTIE